MDIKIIIIVMILCILSSIIAYFVLSSSSSSSQPIGIQTNKAIKTDQSKCVDVPNGTTDNVQLQVYDCNSTKSQQWSYDPTTKLIKNQNGKCMNLYGGTKNVGQWDCSGTATATNEQWNVTDKIRSVYDPTLCLDEFNGNNGDKMIVTTCKDNLSNQMFKWA